MVLFSFNFQCLPNEKANIKLGYFLAYCSVVPEILTGYIIKLRYIFKNYKSKLFKKTVNPAKNVLKRFCVKLTFPKPNGYW